MAATLQMASDFELDRWIKAISRGDRDALANLYHATSSAVFAYALSILKNRIDAEDVLHDCYITIFQSAGDYRSQNKPMAWIMTITRNLCYRLLRRQRRYVSLEAEDYFGEMDADPNDKLLVQSCMKLLTDEERQIVILHAVAGCKHREIAGMLEMKTATVLSKYHRAIQKLRSSL